MFYIGIQCKTFSLNSKANCIYFLAKHFDEFETCLSLWRFLNLFENINLWILNKFCQFEVSHKN